MNRNVRNWIHGIGLAVLPLLVGYGIMEDSEAALWAALLGAIIVPGVALHDSATEEQREEDTYLEGYDDGLAIGERCETCEPGEDNRREL